MLVIDDAPLWGEERIANELLRKLGRQVSPHTRTARVHNGHKGATMKRLAGSLWGLLCVVGLVATTAWAQTATPPAAAWLATGMPPRLYSLCEGLGKKPRLDLLPVTSYPQLDFLTG